MPERKEVEMFTAEQYREIEKSVQRKTRLPGPKRPGSVELWRVKKLYRYWAFRFQNEANGGCIADDQTKEAHQRPPDGFKERMEDTVGFTSWGEFADLWDLDPRDPKVIVHRTRSVWHEHEARMLAIAPVLPVVATIRQSDSNGERIIKRAAIQLKAKQK